MRTDDYQGDWHRYKRLRGRFVIVCVGYAVFSFSVIFSKSWFSVAACVIAGIWMVFVVILGNRLKDWCCPRCGNRFSGSWWYNDAFFDRKCAHCGLPKFAAHDSGSGSVSA